METNTKFRYEIGGELRPIADPLPETAEPESLTTLLAQVGFLEMLTMGDKNGLGMTIYSSKGDDLRWFLVPGDCNSTCLIEVIGWPAYLDALARYAPIYSAPIAD